MLFLATRRVVNRTLVGVLVLGNLLWVVDSVLIAEGFVFPAVTTVGTVVVTAGGRGTAGARLAPRGMTRSGGQARA